MQQPCVLERAAADGGDLCRGVESYARHSRTAVEGTVFDRGYSGWNFKRSQLRITTEGILSDVGKDSGTHESE